MSRICAGLDEVVGAFRTRPLGHIEFPYVYLDATYLHVRNLTSQVTSMAVVVATGITADGNREILGCDIGDSEDEMFWKSFLRTLEARGLGGVRLVISDQHAGLVVPFPGGVLSRLLRAPVNRLRDRNGHSAGRSGRWTAQRVVPATRCSPVLVT